MPEKKNRNHNLRPSLNTRNTSGETESTETDEILQNNTSVSEYSSNNIGIISYLKTHWWAVVLIVFLTMGAFGAGMKYLEESARQSAANGKNQNGEKDQSLFAKLNPFSSAPLPTPSPTPLPLSKEYIYAGSRLLAVEDVNASAVPPADFAIWRPGSGAWWVMGGQNS